MARARKIACRAAWGLGVTLCFAATIASIVFGILLRLKMSSLQANMENDPEKRYLDECMRDFEGLDSQDARYRTELSQCIKDLSNDESLKQLPHIRLTVDERVCGPSDLCTGGDPGDCDDTGTPKTAGYQAGTVTKCYQLIDSAKAEQDAFIRAGLLDRVAKECTSPDTWKTYANSVRLAYCFWKHLQFGVCANNMRTNCPTDADDIHSCCPIAQSDPSNSLAYREDQYICQKSPIVGLYCQHRDFRVPVNISIEPLGALCTTVTCPSFAWCRDLADIPGQCLGEACKDYHRGAEFVIVSIVCATLGLLCDFAVFILLMRWPHLVKLKTTANAVSGCLKVLTYVLCLAGGAKDFTRELVNQQCYNAQGNELAQSAKDGVDLFEMITLITIVGALALAPMSMQWGGPLSGLPYARV